MERSAQEGKATSERGKNISIESLFDNLKRVWISKGKQPVCRDLNVALSKYTSATYTNRFGGWNKALAEFVAFVNQEPQTQQTNKTRSFAKPAISSTEKR